VAPRLTMMKRAVTAVHSNAHVTVHSNVHVTAEQLCSVDLMQQPPRTVDSLVRSDIELCCASVCLQMRCGVSELVALPLGLRRRAHLVCIACMHACMCVCVSRACRVRDTE
jgi:hypothetical protein